MIRQERIRLICSNALLPVLLTEQTPTILENIRPITAASIIFGIPDGHMLGFVVADNFILTATHCVYDLKKEVADNPRERNFTVHCLPDRKKIKAKIVAAKFSIDCALLYANTGDTAPLRLGHEITIGEKVYWHHWDAEKGATTFLGEVVGKKRKLNLGRMLIVFDENLPLERGLVAEISNKTEPGSSGGPLFNLNGEVVGMIIGYNRAPGSVGTYAISIDGIRSFLEELRSQAVF